MTPQVDETRADAIARRIRNHPLAAWSIVATAAVIALGQLTGALNAVVEFVDKRVVPRGASGAHISFVAVWVVDALDVLPVQYEVRPPLDARPGLDSILALERVTYGTVAGDDAVQIDLIFRNATDQPLSLSYDGDQYHLADATGRPARLLTLCCDEAQTLLTPRSQRRVQLTFQLDLRSAVGHLRFRYQGESTTAVWQWDLFPRPIP